jgi:hypothetical protein
MLGVHLLRAAHAHVSDSCVWQGSASAAKTSHSHKHAPPVHPPAAMACTAPHAAAAAAFDSEPLVRDNIARETAS